MEKSQLAPVVKNILDSRAEKKSLSSLVLYFESVLYKNLVKSESLVSDLIDIDFLNEIISLDDHENIFLYFGKVLRSLKIVFRSEENSREIDVFIEYKGPKKIRVIDANLPPSPLQYKDYSSLTGLVTTFMDYIDSLSGYFYEVERIDRFCTVMEPTRPTYRDVYRRILLDDRVWLHVRVTPKGLAADIHLLGNTELWNGKLQAGLHNWNHDMDIVENVTAVFDSWNFQVPPRSPDSEPVPEPLPFEEPLVLQDPQEPPEPKAVQEELVCNICWCTKLKTEPNVPQPLCKNDNCVAYFHRNCLFQWLMACSGGRLVAFGVATGTCPACENPTSCNETDA